MKNFKHLFKVQVYIYSKQWLGYACVCTIVSVFKKRQWLRIRLLILKFENLINVPPVTSQ